ncbi:unnamed protein product, partial [Protopolystoma xenopodis]
FLVGPSGRGTSRDDVSGSFPPESVGVDKAVKASTAQQISMECRGVSPSSGAGLPLRPDDLFQLRAGGSPSPVRTFCYGMLFGILMSTFFLLAVRPYGRAGCRLGCPATLIAGSPSGWPGLGLRSLGLPSFMTKPRGRTIWFFCIIGMLIIGYVFVWSDLSHNTPNSH